MDFNSSFEIARTIDFIRTNNFTRIVLQFPDELLKESTRVAKALKNGLGKGVRLYVMADTAYGSCCVDEVGASHIDAECVVHYGHACMSQLSTLPALFIFGKASLDVNTCADSLYQCLSSTDKPIMVLYGLEYKHAVENLKAVVNKSYISSESNHRVYYAEVPDSVMYPSDFMREKDQVISPDDSSKNAGLSCSEDKNKADQSDCCCRLEAGTSYALGGIKWNIPINRKIEDYLLYWIGSENSAFTNVVMTFNNCDIVRYDAQEGNLLKDFSYQRKILKRRYYLVEKAKDANIVGILVGTLGVAGYLRIVQQMKELIERTGKKSYTLVMGRPNPAKLANFPECDVFVYVSCAQTALMDSKEFLAPVITPFEAMLAFSRGREWTGEYKLDFPDLVTSSMEPMGSITEEARFSFITGGYMEDFLHPQDNTLESEKTSLTLAEATKSLNLQNQSPSALVTKNSARTGAEFLATRSYQGLNMQYENPAPETFVKGRSGRAAVYANEK